MAPASGRDAIEEVIAKRRLRFRFMKHDSWENALFVHWPVDPAFIAARLPRGLEPDVREGHAWVGLVLLTERGVSAHHWLARKLVPPIDHFGANVRTYVRHGDVPGIFFWSLECSSSLASFGARLAGIPYFPAAMRRSVDIERPVGTPGAPSCGDGCLLPRRAEGNAPGGSAGNPQAGDGFTFEFASRRGLLRKGPAVSARWRLPMDGEGGEEQELFAERAQWFLERYSVYAAWPWGRGPVLLRGDVQHPPWAVRPAALEALEAAPLLEAAGLRGICDGPEAQKPHVCFSRGVGPVEFWMLEPV
mmetsp:Transcript_121088/g.353855  ORF Transcript_121088/g.353855 Transcript_121088/m.353855 type:complete len:304 (+) Transcript_121088:83-994(+)